MNRSPVFSVTPQHRLTAGADTPCVDASLTTPNHGGALVAPTLIVLHYTAAESAEGSARWLCQPGAKASAHLVVARGGRVWQLAPCNIQTWHAGQSSWRGRTNLNACSIGIEIANRGGLQVPPPGVPADDYVLATHRHESKPRYWERYPQTQVATVAALCVALQARYPTLTEIVGHDDIAPGRKVDPGPAWDWPAFRAQVTALAQHPGVPT